MTRDLVVLVADLDMEQTLLGLLNKHQRLGIRPITWDIFRHPQRDPGCWNDSHHFLKALANEYQYALVLFDHEGSGQEHQSAETLQTDLENRIGQQGWEDRVCVTVIQPELEIWVWSDSPLVDSCLGWANRTPELRSWLHSQNWLREGQTKPDQPKEAMQAALRVVKRRHSAAIFKQLAEQVSFSRCTDPGFQRLRAQLQAWFS